MPKHTRIHRIVALFALLALIASVIPFSLPPIVSAQQNQPTPLAPNAAFTTSTKINVAHTSYGTRVLAASSTYRQDDAYAPEHILDNNPDTVWRTGRRQTTDQWVTFQIGGDTPAVIHRLALRGVAHPSSIHHFELRVAQNSTDESDFTTVLTGTLPLPSGTDAKDYTKTFSFAPVRAKYIQLRARDNWGSQDYIAIRDVQVWTRDRQGGIVSLREGPPATIVDVSSQQSSEYAAHYALDGDDTTAWRSTYGEKTAQWLTVSPGGNQIATTISGIRLQSDSMRAAVKDFEVRISRTTNDANAYTTVLSTTARRVNTLQTFAFAPVEARYVQLRINNVYGTSSHVGVNTFDILTPDGANVARLDGVGASVSDFSKRHITNAEHNPEHAIDIAPNTAWHAEQGEWVKLRLNNGHSYTIDRVMLNGSSTANMPIDIAIYVSNSTLDDAAFVPVLNATFAHNDQPHWYTFGPVQARYVKLILLNTHNAYSKVAINTFQVYSPHYGGANVAFDDYSTDPHADVVSWEWDFGDNTTSTEQHPVHTYAAPGTYTVSLTVTNSVGLTDVATMNYTVLQAPKADFTWSPANPTMRRDVAFTSTATDADGAIVAWEWLFAPSDSGDKASRAQGQNATHQFATNGDAPVYLRVTDNHLLTTVISKTVAISGTLPALHAGNDQQLTCGQDWSATLDTIITNLANRNNPPTCTWDFGNGETADIPACTSKSARIAHAYTEPGTYTATLTLSDEYGVLASDSLVATVSQRESDLIVYRPRLYEEGHAELQAQLIDMHNRETAMDGHIVRFTVDGHTHTANTDTDGLATIRFPATIGQEMDITAHFEGSQIYSPSRYAGEKTVGRVAPEGDIVFIVDESGSMADDHNEVKMRLNDIVSQLEEEVDFRLGLVGYGALANNGDARIVSTLTDDMQAFRGALDRLHANGMVEPGFRATVMSMDEAMNFRPDSGVCAILISDEDATSNIKPYLPETKQDALDALEKRGAVFLGIVPTDSFWTKLQTKFYLPGMFGAAFIQQDYGPEPGSLADETDGEVFNLFTFRTNPSPVLTSMFNKCTERIREVDAASSDTDTTVAYLDPTETATPTGDRGQETGDRGPGTAVPTDIPTSTPTGNREPGTAVPTDIPTSTPTGNREPGTAVPIDIPTSTPTGNREPGTAVPIDIPTSTPTGNREPGTAVPTDIPTSTPTGNREPGAANSDTTPEATSVPTQAATATSVPIQEPTNTSMPTQAATATSVPIQEPTNTSMPTQAATATSVPIQEPTNTSMPTQAATATSVPTQAATATSVPTQAATATSVPIQEPTNTSMPTQQPTTTPVPTQEPTTTPTLAALPATTPPTTSWDYQCAAQMIDIIGAGMKNRSEQSISVPNNALWSTIQVGGAGYQVQPPQYALLTFAGSSVPVQATTTHILNSSPRIQPAGMMGYTFEVDGQPGKVTAQVIDAQDTTESLIAYAAVPTQDEYSGVGATTLQYAWGGDNGKQAVGPARLDLTLPEPLPATVDVQVKAVVMKKDTQSSRDQRIAIVRAEAGGVTGEVIIKNPDEPNMNITTVTLKDVPAGTQRVSVLLISPATPSGVSQWNNPEAGDSVFLVGATAWHACVQTTPTPEPTATATAKPTNTPTPEPTATATATPTDTPTPEPTATATAKPTDTPTPEPTATATAKPTATATPKPKSTATATPKPKSTATATPKPKPTATATPKPKPTATATPKPKPTATATPKPKPTATATPKPTATATPKPKPTATATPKPTATATPKPAVRRVVATHTPTVQTIATPILPMVTPSGAR